MRDRADPGPGSDGPRAGPPSLDDFNDWPDSPILVKPVPTPGQSYSDLTKGRALINTGRYVLLLQRQCSEVTQHSKPTQSLAELSLFPKSYSCCRIWHEMT